MGSRDTEVGRRGSRVEERDIDRRREMIEWCVEERR